MDEDGERVIYAALGDSTGVGVGAEQGGGYVARLFHRIERVRSRPRLINLCMSGATTADVLREQTPQVKANEPTLLTLGIGINDLGRGVSVESFARNYEAIILRLRERSGAPIVLTNTPDISFAPAVPSFMRDELRRRIRSFNERIAEMAARHEAFLVDVFTSSHELLPAHPEFFSADKFHPSEAGYEYWAKEMWSEVKKAISGKS